MTATDALTHAVYLDRTATGAARIAVTYARKGRRGGGRRIMSLAGRDRDVAYPHIAAILWNYYGKRLRTVADDLPPGEYHAVSELCAAQMLLAMEVVEGGTGCGPRATAGRGSRQYGGLRKRLVVRLPPQPQPAPPGAAGDGADVRLTAARASALTAGARRGNNGHQLDWCNYENRYAYYRPGLLRRDTDFRGPRRHRRPLHRHHGRNRRRLRALPDHGVFHPQTCIFFVAAKWTCGRCCWRRRRTRGSSP